MYLDFLYFVELILINAFIYYIIECYIREYPNSGCFITRYINYDIFKKIEFKYYKNYF